MFKEEGVVYVEKNGVGYMQFKRLLKYGVKHAYTFKRDGIDFSFN